MKKNLDTSLRAPLEGQRPEGQWKQAWHSLTGDSSEVSLGGPLRAEVPADPGLPSVHLRREGATFSPTFQGRRMCADIVSKFKNSNKAERIEMSTQGSWRLNAMTTHKLGEGRRPWHTSARRAHCGAKFQIAVHADATPLGPGEPVRVSDKPSESPVRLPFHLGVGVRGPHNRTHRRPFFNFRAVVNFKLITKTIKTLQNRSDRPLVPRCGVAT